VSSTEEKSKQKEPSYYAHLKDSSINVKLITDITFTIAKFYTGDRFLEISQN